MLEVSYQERNGKVEIFSTLSSDEGPQEDTKSKFQLNSSTSAASPTQLLQKSVDRWE